MATRLLAELTGSNPERWFYFAVHRGDTVRAFLHGAFVLGRGPTDAWVRLHTLGFVPKDAHVEIRGPFDEGYVAGRGFRKLTEYIG